MAGFYDINSIFLPIEFGLFITLLGMSIEIKKAVKKKESKELLKHESPIDWFKSGIKLIILAFFSSLLYALINAEDVILDSSLNLDFLFFFGIFFSILGTFQASRIGWFIVDPTSTSNIFVGKFLHNILKFGKPALYILLVGLLQIFNGFMLYQGLTTIIEGRMLSSFGLIYTITLILSLIVTIPNTYTFLFTKDENATIWDTIMGFCLASPWVVLIIYSIVV